jgi:lysophospholipase L1-like esterase
MSVTIVALGDSTTAGTPGFKSPLEAPPDGSGNPESQYAYWLMRAHPEWRVLNRGINGERAEHIRRRFHRDVTEEQRRTGKGDAFLTVIIAGVNDIYQGRPATAVTQQLQGMYDAAQTVSIAVVAGSIIPFNTATPDQNARMRAVNAWIREYAATHPGITFCDTRAAVTAPDRPDQLISSPDGLHPSPDGYRRMAVALEPIIARLVK